MIQLNIKVYHILTKLFLKDFIKKDHGKILNVASSAGFLAGPRLSTYYATKNYVAKLSMGIYEELKDKKVMYQLVFYVQDQLQQNSQKLQKENF